MYMWEEGRMRYEGRRGQWVTADPMQKQWAATFISYLGFVVASKGFLKEKWFERVQQHETD